MESEFGGRGEGGGMMEEKETLENTIEYDSNKPESDPGQQDLVKEILKKYKIQPN